MLTMIQFIEFYVRTDNAYSTERVRYMLDNLVDLGTVKKWSEHQEEDSMHFTVNGTWTAYSTIAAMIPKKRTPETELLSISIEHFEDD